RRSDFPNEVIGKCIAVSFEGALKVGFKPHDPNGRELPVVADLTTTHETVGGRSIGASKAESGTATDTSNPSLDDSLRDRNRGVEVGFNIAKAGTGIHANVPPGPVIDGRG